jgi:hypothetical protein
MKWVRFSRLSWRSTRVEYGRSFVKSASDLQRRNENQDSVALRPSGAGQVFSDAWSVCGKVGQPAHVICRQLGGQLTRSVGQSGGTWRDE